MLKRSHAQVVEIWCPIHTVCGCPCSVVLCPEFKNQKKKTLQFLDSQNVSASVINSVFFVRFKSSNSLHRLG